MKYLAVIAAAVALVLIPAPASADNLIPSFAFSFGNGTDVISGNIFGEASDRVPGFNWTATAIVITAMPEEMARAIFGTPDLFRDLQDNGRTTINRWNLDGGELVSGSFARRPFCYNECAHLYLNYSRAGGLTGDMFGAIWSFREQRFLAYSHVAGPGTITPVPEPSSLLLLVTGAAGLFQYRRRRLRTGTAS